MAMPTVSDHAAHDELLIARLEAGDLTSDELVRATALATTCESCGRLLADLRAIRTAARTLPSIARPRDFRLTTADADRLRPARWRALLAAFASPRLAFTRPLALGLTTLGLAGLLISLPGALTPAGNVALVPAGAGEAATAQAAPEASPLPAGAGTAGDASAAGPAASAEPPVLTGPAGATAAPASVEPEAPAASSEALPFAAGPEASAGGDREGVNGKRAAAVEAPASGSLPLVPLLAGLTLLLGLGLVGLRTIASRSVR